MKNFWLSLAGFFGLTGVILGALGAHAFHDYDQHYYTLANSFQLWHALALLGVGVLIDVRGPNRLLMISALAFCLGIVLFSGTLYARAFTGTSPIPMGTPAGGILLMVGWALLIPAGLTRRQQP